MSVVFVLGAAANKELDEAGAMPVGSELAAGIQNQLEQELARGSQFPDGPISNAFSSSGGLEADHVSAMRRIQDGITHVDSIDKFVDEWSDRRFVPEVAKASIAQQILQAESKTHFLAALQDPNSANRAMRAIRGSWLGQILRYANPSARRRDVDRCLEGISFVTFNYDRCLEVALFLFLRAQEVGEEECNEILSNLQIHHAYGSLGNFREFGGGGKSIPSGLIARASRGIQTFTEEVESERQKQIRLRLTFAEKIVFLGFGFHRQNLEMICPRSLDGKQVIGTSYGMRDAEKAVVTQYFKQLNAPIHLVDWECNKLLDGFRESLFDS